MNTLIAYLRLLRPANIITAIADICSGVTIGIYLCTPESYSPQFILPLVKLVLSTSCLYGGGVMLNDVADAEIDSIERPERPIPVGAASRNGAAITGLVLLTGGVYFAASLSSTSGYIAACIAVLTLLYNFLSKQHAFFGPLNMGLCRGGNLLLGISFCLPALHNYYLLAALPVIYIAAITLVSRGEVTGGNTVTIKFAAMLFALVIGLIAYTAIVIQSHFVESLIFIALFTFVIYKPLFRAYKVNSPENIKNAVKTAVISIIIFDAAIAVCFGGWWYGLMILLLLPISILLSRLFAVT